MTQKLDYGIISIIKSYPIEMSLKVSKLVSQLLQGLERREQEVVDGRYGLKEGVVRTLAEIGDQYGITRERVRQIEAMGLKKLAKNRDDADLGSFVGLVRDVLKDNGGIQRETLLLDDLRSRIGDPAVSQLANKVQFLLEVAGGASCHPEDGDFYSYWYLSEEDQRRAVGFLSKLVKLMENSKESVLQDPRQVSGLAQEAMRPYDFREAVAQNYLFVSKKFHRNNDNNFGLSHWPEVNPKTVRDWSYLVLKKSRKPAHFEEISKMINRTRKNSQRLAHPQTVHNELIKDPRFVLVGRGTYGLQEFGIMPGTAREVMAKLLKKHGPLVSKDLVNVVLKERMFKKNTVLINLQNRKYFKRLEDGRYTIHEV